PFISPFATMVVAQGEEVSTNVIAVLLTVVFVLRSSNTTCPKSEPSGWIPPTTPKFALPPPFPLTHPPPVPDVAVGCVPPEQSIWGAACASTTSASCACVIGSLVTTYKA